MDSESENNTDMFIDSTNASTTDLSTSRLGMCEVCACKIARYTCPRCEVKTCCLRCARIHKQELECNGARDKTKFIPLNKFTNIDLSSDYRLLEEITRNVMKLKSNPAAKHTPFNRELPHHLFKLRQATNMRKIMLKFLPRDFVRHKENCSYLHFKTNVIFWRIDWIFSNADNLKVTDSKVPETAKLSNLLHKYLIKQEDKVLQEKLQFYRAADLPGVRVFLKAEQKAGCKYYELDLLASLKDNLKNKIVIEYPTIHVVLKEHAGLYDVLDSDDENEEMDVDVNTLNGETVVNRIIKKVEKEEYLDSSLKNLLFISELTDGDSSEAE